ncbi:MAG: hypothetical protein E5299_02422 [Burkholderia gladioli]|nr:MAG: hypothetical protein E5299_02422 [Burkholderia gladioli]
MPPIHIVKLTDNFERNLEEIEVFVMEIDAPQAFEILLDELEDIVIPNLERFPDMGRSFLTRPAHSVEVSNGLARLDDRFKTLIENGELREYVLAHYLLLYLRSEKEIYLLSIRHHRQLSFDFASHWST